MLIAFVSVNLKILLVLEAYFDQNSDVADVWLACEKNAQLAITAPEKLESFSQSCLEIPCNFTPSNSPNSAKFDNRLATGGVWILSDSRFEERESKVIFNSSKERSEYPMKLTGNLSEATCTTLFSNLTTAYSNMYFFRVENGPFKATASCNPVIIQVKGKTFNSLSSVGSACSSCDIYTVRMN